MVRPNQYHTLIAPKLEEIKQLRQEGLSIAKIATSIGATVDQLGHYRKTFKELEDALSVPLEPKVSSERKAKYNRKKNYNSLRSFIRTQSTKDERAEYFRLILEKADKAEIETYRQMAVEALAKGNETI